MSDKICSLKSGRRPVILTPSTAVLTAISVITALTKASDNLKFPKNATSQEKDIIFYEKISKLSKSHTDLPIDTLKSTLEYLSASVKYATEVDTAGQEQIEKAGDHVYRDLTLHEDNVFQSMDSMNIEQLNKMKSVIDLLAIKLRYCYDTNPAVKPEIAVNESMLGIVDYIVKHQDKQEGRFTKKARPEPKSARFSLGASTCDSQTMDLIPEIDDA